MLLLPHSLREGKHRERNKEEKQMLQLLFAVAFSAVPLTLYVPPIRSLNFFVETVEELLRQTTLYTLRAYPRVRLAFSRLVSHFIRLSRST